MLFEIVFVIIATWASCKLLNASREKEISKCKSKFKTEYAKYESDLRKKYAHFDEETKERLIEPLLLEKNIEHAKILSNIMNRTTRYVGG